MTFGQALREGILLGDGANGTCLDERGYHLQPYDLACLDAPHLVEQVHRDYFFAGSDFVETNTFQANRIRFADTSVDVISLNTAAAHAAKNAASSFDGKFILGAMGPVGKPIEPIGSITHSAASAAFAEQAVALADGGVDGFILETFTDLEELKLAIAAVRGVSDLPIIASKAFIEDGEMLAEGFPMRVAKELAALGVTAVGANCIVGPQRMMDLVRMMSESTDVPILAFPTPGLPQLVKGHITYDSTPEYFAKAVARLVEEGARIIGGCCGTTPEHIRQIRLILDKGEIKRSGRTVTLKEHSKKAPLDTTEPTELGQKLKGKKFITAVEMDVPRGLNIEKLLAGARMLKIAGADVINISDGARARLRMNPSAVANLIQTRVGIEVTMHFSCRDRNLLAIQADLLGCHAIGVRNILAVTGDPSNIGDYPSATSVFDIDSIGLARIISRFNQGIDLAGYSVGVECGFTVAVAYNPLALDQKDEDDRLRRKVEAGAHVVYTQPVFDEAVAEGTARLCQTLGIPWFMGILPLRNARHTEFMHNEVPGIQIPEALRKRMMSAPNDNEALEIGIDHACDVAQLAHKIARGIYLMPPFGNPSIARRVMEAIA